MKKTAKIVICIAIAFLLSITALPVSASACTPDAETTVRTATPGEVRALYAMVDAANASIMVAVRIAQLTPYDDVDLLLRTVEAIVEGVSLYADSIGAEIGCEYTEYTIDGRTVMIDPIRVINIRGGGGGGGSGEGEGEGGGE